jgi:hypothetical protein
VINGLKARTKGPPAYSLFSNDVVCSVTLGGCPIFAVFARCWLISVIGTLCAGGNAVLREEAPLTEAGEPPSEKTLFIAHFRGPDMLTSIISAAQNTVKKDIDSLRYGPLGITKAIISAPINISVIPKKAPLLRRERRGC